MDNGNMNGFEMREEYYQSPRGTVYYNVSGKDGAPFLVMLHGLSADHTLFDRQLPHFAERYRVLTWDAPMHGKSRPYQGFSYENMAEDLNAIFRKEGVSRPVLIGQSMGGYIIQSYLLKYPNDASGFVGIDTCPYGTKYYSKSDLFWIDQIGWMSRLYPDKMLKHGVANNCAWTDAGKANMTEALSHYGKRELCDLFGLGYGSFKKSNRDMDISCPALIIAGEHDVTGKVRQYCKMWHDETGYPLVMIKDAAHNSNFDAPVAVNSAIDDFLISIGY